MNKNVKKYFTIRELACSHVAGKHGESAWQFFDNRLLDVLVWLRVGIGLPITVNNWSTGGSYSQRGFRCNCCQLVADKTKSGQVYVSAHTQGMAVDLNVKGMTAEEVRKWIRANEKTLPHAIRLEADVTWVHLDVRNDTDKKIVFFNG